MPFDKDIATGLTESKLKIVGRPRPGEVEQVVILEEATEPVQMHWIKNKRLLLPHYRCDCPNCDEAEDVKAYHYLGCIHLATNSMAILELTMTCYGNLAAGASEHPDTANGFPLRGLLAQIFRGKSSLGQRVLRVKQRLLRVPDWRHHTRRELCRIWGIPVKPRLYKEA
jgi:hypothetical protein